MLFSLLKHYLELYITDTALKVSRSLYCFTTSIFHGVENYFPRLWGTGISDAIFVTLWFRFVTIECLHGCVWLTCMLMCNSDLPYYVIR